MLSDCRCPMKERNRVSVFLSVMKRELMVVSNPDLSRVPCPCPCPATTTTYLDRRRRDLELYTLFVDAIDPKRRLVFDSPVRT